MELERVWLIDVCPIGCADAPVIPACTETVQVYVVPAGTILPPPSMGENEKLFPEQVAKV